MCKKQCKVKNSLFLDNVNASSEKMKLSATSTRVFDGIINAKEILATQPQDAIKVYVNFID